MDRNRKAKRFGIRNPFVPPHPPRNSYSCRCRLTGWDGVAFKVVIGTRTELCTRESTATDASTGKVARRFHRETVTLESGKTGPCQVTASTTSRQRAPGGFMHEWMHKTKCLHIRFGDT